MAANWMRRTALVTACATAVLLAACGSSTTESALKPSRFIAFGDAVTDLGQNGSSYTVNNGSVNIWTRYVASQYGMEIKPSSQGGLNYAFGNARIAVTPDAAGNAATPTLAAQIDSFLAANTLQGDDVVLLNAGLSDMVVGLRAVIDGTQTADQYIASARALGKQYADQIRRLTNAGAKHVVFSGVYSLGRTPWAIERGQAANADQATRAFNDALLIGVTDLGNSTLYVELEYYVNEYVDHPGNYGFSNATTPVCTSVDPGPGIGIGAGEVNSALCTNSTLVAGADPEKFVFADKVYLAPSANRQFGAHAYDKLRFRW
ncbi:SGNH/GDSL hydrolase family protein [Comamonas endophytica]|uniref:SGNH/GDSL hydrolase family protein n=1 Tax=Comamonas endophytica TaxID=2949090 RepID=A0ABY6G5K6_9BURK|nr:MULTISPECIES: SGNH/GDSL hydrolase family protein [unclassified Acidovorax]MCD2512254.1 GDSL family lipase [Acidovorax sp. D4N7]UYG50289.1 SGNH/GDSL hydrolase family protein [Acidovorax sp. 5MLIR]